MKRMIMSGMLLAAVLWGNAAFVGAGEQAPPAGDGPSAMDQGMGGMMGQDRLEKMKEKLGLSDDQVSKLKALFKSQRSVTKPLRDKLKSDMDDLQKKVDAKASDADLKKVLDSLSDDRKNLEAARQKMVDQIREILTPLQQAKFVLAMRERGEKMMGKWMKHHRDMGDSDANGKDGASDK